MGSALVSSLLLAALAQAPRVLAVDPQHSALAYNVVHKLHKVRGESKSVEARAALSADGTARVMVRVPVKSFLSGDGNRDEHMQEVLDAQKHPYVVYKGTTRLEAPTAFPATVDVVLDGELDFHGVKRPLKVPLTLEFRSEGAVTAKGGFSVSLDEFKVERPSLLFVKIDDACRIEVDLTLAAEAP